MLMADAACIPVAYYNDFWLQSPSLKGTGTAPTATGTCSTGILRSNFL